MSELLGTYNPEQMVIAISVGDVAHTINGYADGTFLTFSRLIPASTLYSGADNTRGRVKRTNKDTTITLTLHQFATSNAVLQELQRKDEEDSRNRYVFAITIKDASGTSVWSARQAFISTLPDAPFSTDTSTRDWVITAVNLQSHIGANSEFSQDEVAALAALDYDVPIDWQIQ